MVYILHFNEPLHHAKHYVGFSAHVEQRVEHHRNGTAHCRLTEVLRERGITFTVARIMDGDRTTERALKNTKNTARYCPICNPLAPEYHPRSNQ